MFDFQKSIGTQRGFFTHTGVGKTRSKVEILAEDVERLAGNGYGRKELAKHYNLGYSLLCRRISERHSLTEAFNRGQAKFKLKTI